MADTGVERAWLDARIGKKIGITLMSGHRTRPANMSGGFPFGTLVGYDDVCLEVLLHDEQPSVLFYRQAIEQLFEMRPEEYP